MKLHRCPIVIVTLGFSVIFSVSHGSPAAAGTSQLLVNGGFEQESLDLWNILSEDTSFSRTAVLKNSGSYGAALTSNSLAEKRVYQTVAVVGGSPYAFKGYVLKNDPQVDSALFMIAWYASADGSGAMLPNPNVTVTVYTNAQEFRLLSLAVTAPPEARSASVIGILRPASPDEASVYFDDLSLEGELPASTPVPTASPTQTPTATLTSTATSTPTATPTLPHTATASPTLKPSPSATATRTPTPTVTPIPLPTATATPVPTSTPSPRPTATSTPIPGASVAPSPTPAPTPEPGVQVPDRAANVLISEVYVNPSEDIEPANEWVELYNAGSQDVDLANWTLADNLVEVALPAGVIGPHSYLMVVADGERFRDAYPSFNGTVMQSPAHRIGNGLSNVADMVVLRDHVGQMEDSVNWGRPQSTWPNYHSGLWDPGLSSPSSGHSLVRTAGQDAALYADAWTSAPRPSPGEPALFVALSPTPSVTGTATRAPSRTATSTATHTRTPSPVVGATPKNAVPPVVSATLVGSASVGPATETGLFGVPTLASSTFPPVPLSTPFQTALPVTPAPGYVQASSPVPPASATASEPFVPLASAREPQRDRQAPAQSPEVRTASSNPEEESPSGPPDLIPLLFVAGPSLGLILYLRRCFFS